MLKKNISKNALYTVKAVLDVYYYSQVGSVLKKLLNPSSLTQPKTSMSPHFALDSEHIVLEELFKTITSSLGPWLHPST